MTAALCGFGSLFVHLGGSARPQKLCPLAAPAGHRALTPGSSPPAECVCPGFMQRDLTGNTLRLSLIEFEERVRSSTCQKSEPPPPHSLHPPQGSCWRTRGEGRRDGWHRRWWRQQLGSAQWEEFKDPTQQQSACLRLLPLEEEALVAWSPSALIIQLVRRVSYSLSSDI